MSTSRRHLPSVPAQAVGGNQIIPQRKGIMYIYIYIMPFRWTKNSLYLHAIQLESLWRNSMANLGKDDNILPNIYVPNKI